MTSPSEQRNPVDHFLTWLIAMDDPEDKQGIRARQTVTLSYIIDRARETQLWLRVDRSPEDDEQSIEELATARERAIPVIEAELLECFPTSVDPAQVRNIAKAALNALSDHPDLWVELGRRSQGEDN